MTRVEMYIAMCTPKEGLNIYDECKKRVDKLVSDNMINAYNTCAYHAYTIPYDNFFALVTINPV